MPRKKTQPTLINVLNARLADMIHDVDILAEAVTEAGAQANLDATVSLFADLRNRQDQVKRLSAKLAKLSDYMSFELLPDIFQRTNTVSPYNHIRGKFTLATRTNAACKDGMKDEAFTWLEDHGLGDIIIRTVPWQTFGATAAELIKEGKDLPDDLFEVSTRVYTRFTPAGKKDSE